MNRENVLRKKFLMLALGIASVLSIAACTEKLESGTACPLLCPQQAATLKDTTIEAIVFDTTISGLPSIGAERYLMLASHGDTLDTRAIVRFDTLPQTFVGANNTDSIIAKLDTAMLIVPIIRPDSLHRPRTPITIEAYNVDSFPPDSITLPTDTVASVIATLFRPARLLGSKTFAPESLLDTLQIPLQADSVLDRVLKGNRLRVGFRMVTPAGQGYDLRIGTTGTSTPVTLRMRASKDTAAKAVFVSPLSNTPKGQEFIAGPLADYSIVVKGGGAATSQLLAVGGVPSRRSLLRFNVPSHIVDSTTIVRASLLLTQTPNRRVAVRDSVYVFPSAILAQSGSAITDIRTLLQFVGFAGQFGLDSLRMAPGDSGLRSFQVVGLVRTWKGNTSAVSPRELSLRSTTEGQTPGEIDFFSVEAAPALRPRLRITYVPQTSFGLP
jgi:hypothetical protein